LIVRRRFAITDRRRLRWLLLAAAALMAIGLPLACYAAHLFSGADGESIDTRFAVRGPQRPPRNLVIVRIDAQTFQDLDQQWPFPRRIFARLLRRIAAQRPTAIAVDVQFSEASSHGLSDDEALATAIQATAGHAVFAFTETNAHGDVRFLGSTEGTKLLAELHARAASALLNTDSDGVVRRLQYSAGGLETFAVVTAHLAEHRQIAPTQVPNDAYIDYPGSAGTVPSVSMAAAYGCRACGSLPPGFFHHKIVVIGATAPSLHDVHATSTDALMSGVEGQADAIATVLAGFPLRSVAGWLNVVLIVALGALLPLVSLRFRPVWMTLTAILAGLALAAIAQIAFVDGWIVSFIYPLGALVVGFLASAAVQLVSEAFERLRTRDLFQRFVPERVVDELLSQTDGLRLGGVEREATVMFCDLRGFTSLAETLAPVRVIAILNRYLTEMSDAILDHGGTLVSYMGDGIFSVFGAPLVQDDHADRALATAREMLTNRLPRFNAWLAEEGLSSGLRMGIGLNSGHVMSGHVGSERRVEYAAVGDTTNAASRIESLTKETPYQLLLADSVRQRLRDAPSELEFVMETEVRGRAERMRLWSLPTWEAVSPQGPADAAATARPAESV
jgi:adenylate cyclase